MFIGDQRYIEPFLRDFLQFFGLKAEKKKIEVEAEMPKYNIGVTVQPLPMDQEAVKPDLEIEDFSESAEESDDSKQEDSEQSIELMPVNKKPKPKQVSRPETASRPGTGQSGVDGFQVKKNEAGKDVFLDDVNNGKKVGIDYDPFSYAPVKSRPITKDLRPGSNDVNKLISRPMSNDINKPNGSVNNMARPISNDFNKPISRPLSKDINKPNVSVNNLTRPISNDFNKPNISVNNIARPISNDFNKPVSRPLSKDVNNNWASFTGNNNMNASNNVKRPISNGNQIIEIRPKSKDNDNKGTAKLELVDSRPVSKDYMINNKKDLNDWGAAFMKPPKQDSRPVSKDLFMNNKMEESGDVDLFHKSRMNDDTIKFENLSMDNNDLENNNNKGNKPNYRLN